MVSGDKNVDRKKTPLGPSVYINIWKMRYLSIHTLNLLILKIIMYIVLSGSRVLHDTWSGTYATYIVCYILVMICTIYLSYMCVICV